MTNSFNPAYFGESISHYTILITYLNSDRIIPHLTNSGVLNLPASHIFLISSNDCKYGGRLLEAVNKGMKFKLDIII